MKELDPSQLHHAYLIEGAPDDVRPELFEFLEKKLGHATQANPDFWHERFDTLAVDDARRLRELQSQTALRSAGRKIFVLELLFATHEAQNALLKVFEEPNPGTHFFIVAPTREIFLPTVRSRLFVISGGDKKPGAAQAAIAKEFITMSIPERLQHVSGIIEEKDKAQAIALVDGLIRAAAAQPERNGRALSQMLDMRKYLNDRSPSLKLILEHIALVI